MLQFLKSILDLIFDHDIAVTLRDEEHVCVVFGGLIVLGYEGVLRGC
jgi:hypothetical protein